MDRLNPLDALFVDAEDQDSHTSMAIASIAVFEGPVPSQEEVLAFLAGRLPLVTRYRQKLRMVPFRLGRPVWVDDPDFDIRYHVRRTALPAPGGDEQLTNLMGRVMSQRLDRDHPLWEYWLVEGLAQDRWALISKIHHCMVDGISGTDLYRVILDFTPEPSRPVAGDWVVGPEPSSRQLAVQAALDIVLLPLREAVALSAAVATDPGDAVRQVTATLRAAAKLAQLFGRAALSNTAPARSATVRIAKRTGPGRLPHPRQGAGLAQATALAPGQGEAGRCANRAASRYSAPLIMGDELTPASEDRPERPV